LRGERDLKPTLGIEMSVWKEESWVGKRKSFMNERELKLRKM
jgi:hypothetical protein